MPEYAGCFPSAVVIMTTADGMYPAFSGRHRKLFIISDLYRSLTTSHGYYRSALYPCYINGIVKMLCEYTTCYLFYYAKAKLYFVETIL